jgi:hypothetical protein
MYNNIGNKIKTFAKISFYVMAILLFTTGLVLLIDTEAWPYAILMVFGPIVSWISSWMLYAYGELVERATSIDSGINEINTKLSQAHPKGYDSNYVNERLATIERLRQKNLITEEEYQSAIARSTKG